MAAKSKKRLSKIENKLLELEKIELKDIVCSICQSILIEPVTLPCYHYFCQRCFNGSIENNALCCPLCRLRIGSWLRTATKQKNIVNIELWNFIKTKFSREINSKLKGEDLNLPEEKPVLRLSAPGEIRSEYEAELKRLQAERLALEQKHIHETEELIKKIQEEEQHAHQQYLERLKQDEILAQKIQKEHLKNTSVGSVPKKNNVQQEPIIKPKLKPTTIDGYLHKVQPPTVKDSPLLTDDNTNSDSSTPNVNHKLNNRPSPEMLPSYGRLLKNLIDKKMKSGNSFWNKENGASDTGTTEDPHTSHNEMDSSENKNVKTKNGIKSLLVSLPLPSSGVPHCMQNKLHILENRNIRTGSVDSMHQELCYFKPIERTTPVTVTTSTKSLHVPVRVPCIRSGAETHSPPHELPPSRAQYIKGLCQLRSLSLASNLPSAFAIAVNILKAKKDMPGRFTRNKTRIRKPARCKEPSPSKKQASTKVKTGAPVNGTAKPDDDSTLRRTRSMGSLKDENETTPKKVNVQERKIMSDRKPYLRSVSKQINTKKRSSSPSNPEKLVNNKVNLAVKNLSSPLKNCDVKKILEEQLRIEKIIEQEKIDLEMARKMDIELNGRRQPRRNAVKRQVTLNYALRPAKKLKV